MATLRLVRVVSTIALMTALVLVVVLARQNRSLRAALTRARLDGAIPPVGFVVPAFRGMTLAGDSVTIGRAQGSQVLFFFNTTCPVCPRAVPAWQAIARRTGHAFGVTQDPDSAVRAFVVHHGIEFDIVRFPDPTYAPLYRADAVPLTVVVDSSGKVLGRRPGVLSPNATDSIIRLALGLADR